MDQDEERYATKLADLVRKRKYSEAAALQKAHGEQPSEAKGQDLVGNAGAAHPQRSSCFFSSAYSSPVAHAGGVGLLPAYAMDALTSLECRW